LASIIDKRLGLHQRLAEQEQENDALKSQNTQLQALANLGSATSMIAHEINNLLTPLATYAALAVRNSEDRQLVDKVLEKTVRNCERASKIMTSMLAVANGQAQDTETVRVGALIDEVFTSLCRDFAKDGITVTTDVPDDLEVPCVPVQIQQMLMQQFPMMSLEQKTSLCGMQVLYRYLSNVYAQMTPGQKQQMQNQMIQQQMAQQQMMQQQQQQMSGADAAFAQGYQQAHQQATMEPQWPAGVDTPAEKQAYLQQMRGNMNANAATMGMYNDMMMGTHATMLNTIENFGDTGAYWEYK